MEYLRRIRKDAKKTQQDIADYLGITRQAYAHYETDNREPGIETLLKLADYFGVTVDELLRGNKKTPPANGERTITNDELKRALFGTEHIDDNALDDVKQYAEFVASKQDEDIPELSTA